MIHSRHASLTLSTSGIHVLGLLRRFPDGTSGAGLLLIRATIGGMVAAQGVLYLASHGEPAAGVWLLGLIAIVSGVGLVIGLLTSICAFLIGLAGAAAAVHWIPVPGPLGTPASLLALVPVAAGLALLGPGAISCDAVLFGRREVIIPPMVKDSHH